MIPHFINVSFRTTRLSITVDSSARLEVSVGKLKGRIYASQGDSGGWESSANHKIVAVDYLIIGGIAQQGADLRGLLAANAFDIG